VAGFECDLVLRENGFEERRPHTFMVEVQPGTMLHLEGREWVVTEVGDRPGSLPEVVCRPVAERV
jgi:hypothetical protein